MNRPARQLTSCILALALSQIVTAQSWTNLGSGKAGTLGVPVLVATPLRIGSPVVASALSARPGSAAWFVIGSARIDLPILGGTLVPSLAFVVPARTNAAGVASIAFAVPNDPKFVAIRPIVQAIIADPLATQGAAFSNAIEGD